MDGNRRYARLHHKQISEGHSEGFLALRRVCLDISTRLCTRLILTFFFMQMLEICMQLHVRCVTAYAFAIENFKRSPEEVDALMNLAVEKLVEISQHG